jgi:Mg-chelatase subunit ChlD
MDRRDYNPARLQAREVCVRSMVCASAVMLAFLVSAHASAQVPRSVYVSVVDRAGAPVLDLTTDDFEVRETGVTRRIVRAELAAEPMRIALLVDSSGAVNQVINHFRAGLLAFLDGLPEGAEIGIMSIGRQARLRLQPTSDRKKLKDLFAGFFPDGGGTAILDGIIESHGRFLKKAEGRWPLMVIVTTDGPVAGTTRDDDLQRIAQEMQRGAVAVHALVLSTRGGGIPTTVSLYITRATGGRYEAIAGASYMPDKLKELASQLTADSQKAGSQYKIEFIAASTESSGIEVGVRRPGARVSGSDRRQTR